MARNEKVTILDIARHTGLSKGTVDRVLHNRGEVSKRSYDKIMAAVRELGYEPNIHASLLARGGNPLIAVLIPRHSPDSFWDLASQGIAKASESVEAIDVDIRLFEYDQYDLESFREACNRLVDASPAGVVLAPIFRDETDLLTSRLSLSGIPYVFVDSKPDKEDYLAYFGMPPYRSGYLCADQLTGGRKIASALTVRIRRDRQQQSDPTLNRRAGFMDYMLEHNPECTLSSIFIDPNDPEGVEATLSEWFESHPEVHHIVMFNSRIHLLVPFFESHPDPLRRTVGFDNLKANLEAVRNGTVSVLIAQRPDEQMSLAIRTLSEYVLLRKTPQKRDNFVHMDILTRYNIDYY